MAVSDAVIRLLVLHEGERLFPYRDPLGKITIGVGRNLTDLGISQEESRFLLLGDLARVEQELDRALPWWRQEDAVRQAALIDLAFNLGLPRLLRFRRTLEAWRLGKHEAAADALVDSLWYGQVKTRGRRIVAMVRTGQWPPELQV